MILFQTEGRMNKLGKTAPWVRISGVIPQHVAQAVSPRLMASGCAITLQGCYSKYGFALPGEDEIPKPKRKYTKRQPQPTPKPLLEKDLYVNPSEVEVPKQRKKYTWSLAARTRHSQTMTFVARTRKSRKKKSKRVSPAGVTA